MTEYDFKQTCNSIRQLNLTGNVIPHSWYSKITFKNGTPDLLATVLLADIVYWYRPVEIKDEKTGRLIGYKKKFRADMLQRSLSDFAKQFGYNKRQIADALKRLEEAGLIIKNLRTIETSMGIMNNVLFVAPVPSAIAELDYNTDQDCLSEISTSDDCMSSVFISSDVPPTTIERSRVYDRTYQVGRSNAVGSTVERGTYTKNTTKITTENTTAACERRASVAAAAFSKKINPEEKDALIADTLTANQFSIVENTARELSSCVNRNPEVFAKELEAVILSSTSFTQANRDFFKKLNTIKKMIKERGWQTPATFIEKKESERKKTIDPIKQELNENELDCAHWEKMIRMSLEKGQAQQAEEFKKLYLQAKQNLELTKKKLNQYEV